MGQFKVCVTYFNECFMYVFGNCGSCIHNKDHICIKYANVGAVANTEECDCNARTLCKGEFWFPNDVVAEKIKKFLKAIRSI